MNISEEDKKHLQELRGKIKNVILVILAVIAILATFKACDSQAQLAQTTSLYEAANAKLITWKDKDSLSNAKIAILQADNIGAFTQLETSEAEIIRLKEEVKRYKKKLTPGSSVTVITTEGKVADTFKTDTIYVDKNCPDANPTYKADYNFNDWVWGTVVANKDSIGISVKYKEDLTFVLGEEKTGFLGLGKRKSFAEVRLNNPYSEVESMRTFQITPPTPKRFGVGPTLSYGIGSGFTSQVFVGVGINWNIIRF
jgi:hypothetical protein